MRGWGFTLFGEAELRVMQLEPKNCPHHVDEVSQSGLCSYWGALALPTRSLSSPEAWRREAMRIIDGREPDLVIEASKEEWMRMREAAVEDGGLILKDDETGLTYWLTHTGHLVLIVKRRDEDENDAGERGEAVS